MNKLFLIFIALAACFVSAQAQNRHGRGREVLEFKMKYLAQEMNLSEELQPRFFELYTRMDGEIRKVFHTVRAAEKRVDSGRNASEADYAALNKARTDAKASLADIEKKYDPMFAEFLTKKQIVKMKEAEADFRKKMREARHKKHPRP